MNECSHKYVFHKVEKKGEYLFKCHECGNIKALNNISLTSSVIESNDSDIQEEIFIAAGYYFEIVDRLFIVQNIIQNHIKGHVALDEERKAEIEEIQTRIYKMYQWSVDKWNEANERKK